MPTTKSMKFNHSSSAIIVTPYDFMTDRKNLDRNIIDLESLVRPSEYFAERYNQLQRHHSCEPNEREVMQLLNDCQVTDDPLLHWIDYINYVKTKYSNSDERISTIYKRCVNTLVCIKRYKSDERFIRVCISYADRSKRSLKEFEYFYKMKIGISHAMMWMCWTWSAEKYGNYKLADNIFKKALEKKIEPVALVSERFHQFRRRMQLKEPKFLVDGVTGNEHADENGTVSRTTLQMRKTPGVDKQIKEVSEKELGKGAKRQKITIGNDIVAFQDVTNSCFRENPKKSMIKSYPCNFISIFDESGHETCFERERAKISRVVLRDKNNFNSLAEGFSKRNEASTSSYDDIHTQDIQNAINVLMNTKVYRKTSSKVYLRVEEKIPKCLVKSGKKICSFKLDNNEYDVLHKLGSGSNGTVFLCGSKDSSKHQGIFALKVQSPVGCLAWEFMLLERLKRRVKEFNVIPNVRSISLFADGGAMQMTAGSQSGFTLLDLVNMYKGNVPELLAIHYTHRMLTVIEILHLRGKILVSYPFTRKRYLVS